MAQESWKKDTDQTPEGTILCANNCGFFGSAMTNNLCSKCYRDLVMKQQSVVTPTISKMEKAFSFGSSLMPCRATNEEPVKLDVISAVNVDKDQSQDSCSKQSVNRCVQCRKRVGLTGFKCRCGGTFCSAHRYSESHKCSFEYKRTGREAIEKENPVVKAEKIEKI